MSRKKELMEKRNKQIAKRYMEHHNKGLRHEIICKLVGDEFYLVPEYIEKIVVAQKKL